MPQITPLRLDGVLGAEAGGYDDIIDARSPSEYAEDHLPGAINLPVLSDEERAQVGFIYKQVSPFDARKLGAALVAQNVARHLQGTLADRQGDYRPLIYCWRGGQRSGSFALILSQIGWRVGVIEGGYKSWRRLVVDQVQNGKIMSPMIALDGNTGSGKTAILHHLARQGHQILDLEGLANHRGSLFGDMGPQPSQKMFEGRLATAIARLDPSRPVMVEAESSRIGKLSLPKAIWADLCQAPRIVLKIPDHERALYSARDYADMVSDPARLDRVLTRLSYGHPADRLDEWRALAGAGDWPNLALRLMREHYDPRYGQHRARHLDRAIIDVALADLNDLDHAAAQVSAAASRIG